MKDSGGLDFTGWTKVLRLRDLLSRSKDRGNKTISQGLQPNRLQ